MPRGDGTGPAGMGPMTGRAAGFCAGYGMPGYANPGYGFGGRGRGMGFGRGPGRGWQRWAMPWKQPYQPAPFAREQELEMLKTQAESLQADLKDIAARIEEIETVAK